MAALCCEAPQRCIAAVVFAVDLTHPPHLPVGTRAVCYQGERQRRSITHYIQQSHRPISLPGAARQLELLTSSRRQQQQQQVLLDSVSGLGFYFYTCRAAVTAPLWPPGTSGPRGSNLAAGVCTPAVLTAALVCCAHRQLLTEQALLQHTPAHRTRHPPTAPASSSIQQHKATATAPPAPAAAAAPAA